MDRHERLAVLAEAAQDDREQGLPGRPRFDEGAAGVRTVRLPGGRSTRIMRIMQTNACSLSCGYCPVFGGGRVRRTALAPEEVARTFMEAHRAGAADGLFLTSGVPGRPVRAMDRMLAAVEILRRREGFRGYVHVKVLPGAERDQVVEAARLATRVSVNLEAPTPEAVRGLAPDKDLAGDLLPSLELAGALWRQGRLERGPTALLPAGTTTQFVVGAQGERDREILEVVGRLERQGLLHHAHFSAFQPVAGTPMQGQPPTPVEREARLYQAEHLLRRYGFSVQELPFDRDGNLPLDQDPKTAWALAHPERFPVSIERASYETLLRVPGVGPMAARRLVALRRQTPPRGREDLRRLGVDVTRAASFVTVRGTRLAPTPPPRQLRLFPSGRHLPAVVWKTSVPPCAYR